MSELQNQPPTPDEHRDRLLDQALRELHGREVPPDLSAKILQARPLQRLGADQAISQVARQRRLGPALAVAAALLVAASVVLLPRIRDVREAARRSHLQTLVTPQLVIEEEEPDVELASGMAGGPMLPAPDAKRSMAPKAKQEVLRQLPQALAGRPTPYYVDEALARSRWGQPAPGVAPASAPVDALGRALPRKPSRLGYRVAGPAIIIQEEDEERLGVDELRTELDVVDGVTGDANYMEYELPKLKSDIKLYQQQLLTLQKEQEDVNVLKDLALQAASGSSRLEVAVQATIDADPMIANYKQQLFEMDQMIQQLQSTTRNQNSAGIRQRIGQREQMMQQMAAYRANAEKEAREKYATYPGQVLQSAIVEYNIRAKSIAARQAEFARKLMEAEKRIAGMMPAESRDRYARIEENPFKAVSAANTDNRLSTFSIDVDTASYANVRQYLLGEQTLPPPDAVRIEELVNYFQYDYSPPTGDVPFAAHVETAACPWNGEHRLARVAIKGREMDRAKRPKSNLVFLIDVSGSMDEPAKLPLLVEGMRMLTRELGENDRVSIVVYAGSEGLALPSTPGTDQPTILAALDKLSAGGSTAGGAGIALAYKIAKENFIAGATNRVILCTDGDFNVGVTSTADLERMAETQAKETGVFLTVLGFGRGNLNDEMMERIADKGNGNYHYVDGRSEARKVLVEEMTGTLVTIAKDVKIQVEFNPAQVAGYRLIGYENRVLAAEDFNDDKKDAGEIGAGHTVTALYEIIPAGQKVEAGQVDDLKYGGPASSESAAGEPASAERAPTEGSSSPSPELLTLKIRYKAPDGDTSTKLEFPITDNGQPFAKASQDFQFASAVASFGMLLRHSQFKGNATYAAVAEIAEAASKDRDPHGYRKEFVEMVAKAKELAGE